MKKFIIIFLLFHNSIYGSEIKFEKIFDNLDKPWSLSFIDKENILITEKDGKLFTLNLINKELIEINHNLSIISLGQGGLLDVLYKDKHVYISYSEKRNNQKTSTSVAKGRFNKKIINFKNLFRAEAPIKSGYHFGSRLIIKDKHLYITVGERGQGMIAQDFTKHPGSIIRINIDGIYFSKISRRWMVTIVRRCRY